MFSTEEIVYILILSALTLGILIKSFFSKDNFQIWNPLTFVSIFFIYYTLLGPIFSVINENTFARNVDHREYLIVGWRCAVVSFISIIAGFSVLKKINVKKLYFSFSQNSLKKIGLLSFGICLVFLFAFAGKGFFSKINFLDEQVTGDGYSGAFWSYLMQSLNFFITSSVILLLYALKSKKTILFIVVFAFSAALFINEAFRFRLVILLLSCISVFYIYKDKKPNLILLSAVAVLFVFSMGVIEYSRSYGKGLNVEKLNDFDNEKLLEGGLNESAVFASTSYLISQVDEGVVEYTSFDMFINAISAPIPRKFWPDKPEGEYFLGTMDKIYGIYAKGQAMLFFGEYYLSFGWTGVILFSFLLGLFFKRIWLWFIANRHNELAIAAIAIFNSFIYVIVSRGYLSQVITIYIFTVFPTFFIIYMYNKRKINAFG